MDGSALDLNLAAVIPVMDLEGVQDPSRCLAKVQIIAEEQRKKWTKDQESKRARETDKQ